MKRSAHLEGRSRREAAAESNVSAEFESGTGVSPVSRASVPLAFPQIHAWGLDLSGTETGAGGLGGLLFAKLHSTAGAPVLAPCYDGTQGDWREPRETNRRFARQGETSARRERVNCSGNILAYLDCATGQTLARYEYDPFGKLLLKEEDTRVAGRLHHQFSTKYSDDETGLSYYGYRYYAPELGRWINRDPIGDGGGVHLYGFLANNGIRSTDLIGLCDCICVPPDPNEECWKRFMELPPQEQWNHTCCGGQLRLKYGYRFSFEAIMDFESKGIHRAGQCISDVWYPGDLGDPTMNSDTQDFPVDFGVGVIGAAGVVGAELGTSGPSTSVSPSTSLPSLGGVAGITATVGESSGWGVCVSGGGGDVIGGAFSLSITEGGVGYGAFIGGGFCHAGP